METRPAQAWYPESNVEGAGKNRDSAGQGGCARSRNRLPRRMSGRLPTTPSRTDMRCGCLPSALPRATSRSRTRALSCAKGLCASLTRRGARANCALHDDGRDAPTRRIGHGRHGGPLDRAAGSEGGARRAAGGDRHRQGEHRNPLAERGRAGGAAREGRGGGHGGRGACATRRSRGGRRRRGASGEAGGKGRHSRSAFRAGHPGTRRRRKWRPRHAGRAQRRAGARAGPEQGAGIRRRRLIAEHMVYSKATSPHVPCTAEVDMTNLTKLRNEWKRAKETGGKAPSFLVGVCRATVQALAEFPRLNAVVQDESVILRKDVNLGVAVETEKGLLVPVIRKANELSVLGLARAIDDLAARGRTGKLTADELSR